MFVLVLGTGMQGTQCKVALVGPESCGKTTLAEALAERLRNAGESCALVPEYARAYYAERPYRPTLDDLLAIARGQLAAEAQAAASGARWLLCDSTVLTCLIWSEVAFGTVDPALTALYLPRNYALTLLPLPDIPWTPDPLRTHPDGRATLLMRYRSALHADGSTVREIAGEGLARVDLAWRALRQIQPKLPKI
ncbi:AAA family ATPase [Paludibacterium purpuratum]|uniref:Nicotinamide riboside kinase n=1 Tax=Paludibacterium purpuratum TaxID=1144873 RepID=A0A4R7BC64_9NEIS|nr:ATP-binding protein [Paludibacterium purpuratum]TDR82640.1 nicotinamide riboside kinase [Paludibacterium purpuratum]